MDKQHPYNRIIEDKLEHLPGADSPQLWDGMRSILDKEMPQKEDKRRYLGWVLTSKGMVLLAAASLLTFCSLVVISLTTQKPTTENKSSLQNTLSNPSTPSISKSSINSQAQKDNSIPVIHPAQADDEATQRVATNKINITVRQDQDNTKATPSTLPSITKSQADGNAVKKAENGSDNQTTSVHQDENQVTVHTALTNESVSAPQSTASASNGLTTTSLPTATLGSVPSLNPAGPVTNTSSLTGLLAQQKNAAARVGLEKVEKGPYIGLLVGVDLSSIGFKSMRAGANKGFVAGYAFNKRWSVESGLFWNNKNYFGDGSYFHPDGYSLPAGVQMLAVNGKNELYEWPVNVKYTILTQQHGLFVTAGLSSYYMKNERYDYEYELNGQAGKSYSRYKNETKNWFSVANFSLGYTYRIGTSGSIRIEPYLKLPIKDLGVNNMPVVSTGLNVGFTKQLFK